MTPPAAAPDERIAALARRQKGLVTRAQLVAEGLGRDAVRRRLSRGTLHRIHRGVYAVGHDALPAEARWLAAVLAAGEGAVLSHGSAAALWGIGPVVVSPVHVTTPTHRRSRPGVVLHRTTRRADATTRRGIPVTTVQRTLDDLPGSQAERARREAVVRGYVEPHAGEPRLRSRLESRFHRLVRAHGLPPPEVNAVVEGRERDFAWREHRVVVEVDGPHHDDRAVRRADRRRDRELTAAGWRVLRYGAVELGDVNTLSALRELLR